MRTVAISQNSKAHDSPSYLRRLGKQMIGAPFYSSSPMSCVPPPQLMVVVRRHLHHHPIQHALHPRPRCWRQHYCGHRRATRSPSRTPWRARTICHPKLHHCSAHALSDVLQSSSPTFLRDTYPPLFNPRLFVSATSHRRRSCPPNPLLVSLLMDVPPSRQPHRTVFHNSTPSTSTTSPTC